MSAIEENNRERLLALGGMPASEMTKREHIATEAMAALIKSMDIRSEENIGRAADLATKMADAMIKAMS